MRVYFQINPGLHFGYSRARDTHVFGVHGDVGRDSVHFDCDLHLSGERVPVVTLVVSGHKTQSVSKWLRVTW